MCERTTTSPRFRTRSCLPFSPFVCAQTGFTRLCYHLKEPYFFNSSLLAAVDTGLLLGKQFCCWRSSCHYVYQRKNWPMITCVLKFLKRIRSEPRLGYFHDTVGPDAFLPWRCLPACNRTNQGASVSDSTLRRPPTRARRFRGIR